MPPKWCGTKNKVAGIYFMEDVPQDGKPIQLNWILSIVCGMVKFEAASAAEAEAEALFVHMKRNQDNTLDSWGNGASTATNSSTYIVTTKLQQAFQMTLRKNIHRSQSIWNALFLGHRSSKKKKMLDITWQPGVENFCALLLKASFVITRQEGTFVVHARPKFREGTSTGASSKYSKRVCWNPGTWIRTLIKSDLFLKVLLLGQRALVCMYVC